MLHTCRRLSHRLGASTVGQRSRLIQTACTVHDASLSTALQTAIAEASAPHHGFTSSDMPSQAIVFISRHYFPTLSAERLGENIHSLITGALGDDTIDVIGAVVDDVSTASASKGRKGVSLLLVSEDEQAKVHVFEDFVNRDISLGRAWKSQGDALNEETMDDQWVPSGDWKTLLSGGTSEAPSQTNNIKGHSQVMTAIVVSKSEFSSIDWPAKLFPNANKYGMTPAATPFLTGFPITMLHNRKLLTNGGIALAFTSKRKKVEILHPGLKRLGEPLRVTK